jgi:O-methyltransferase involved in polyketide biosynthesis
MLRTPDSTAVISIEVHRCLPAGHLTVARTTLEIKADRLDHRLVTERRLDPRGIGHLHREADILRQEFVPADFERDDLGSALRQAGFRADQAACVSWMGVTMYLTADAVAATLRTVAGFAAGSRLCFDYRVPATMLNPIERLINQVMERRVAAPGEPWLSTFDPTQLQRQLLELGFSTAESATPEDLNARYFARRKDGLRTGGGVRIMCANK